MIPLYARKPQSALRSLSLKPLCQMARGHPLDPIAAGVGKVETCSIAGRSVDATYRDIWSRLIMHMQVDLDRSAMLLPNKKETDPTLTTVGGSFCTPKFSWIGQG